MGFFNFFSKKPRSLFLEFSPEGATWQVISWNFDLKSYGERAWALEVHKKNDVESINWSRKQHEELSFFCQDKLISRKKISDDRNELKELMNLSLHGTLKAALTAHHDFVLAPVSGATTADFQNEARALQWIQASFGTLDRALDQFKNRSDLILTAAFFSGLEPESGRKVLRVLAFNLDIFCYFLEDNSLQIAVFDDKNLGCGGAKTPSFQQIIKVTKPQIYDEIVKLVNRIAVVGEVD